MFETMFRAPQQMFDFWKKTTEGHLARTEEMMAAFAKVEKDQVAHATTMFDEVAKIGRAQFTESVVLAGEWRKQWVDAMTPNAG